MNPRLKTVRFPAIGVPGEPRPELPPAVFAARLRKLRTRMEERGLEAMVVYGDREHFANLHWLTNYDPRFEEALLVVRRTGRPILFVGNEGMTYSKVARLDVERRLYQTFSLLGQPREKAKPLARTLRDAGLSDLRRVGAAGWKYFTDAEFPDARRVLDLPEFIAQSVRATLSSVGGTLTNEGAIFMDAETGLRSILEPEQIADFEWIATLNSECLLNGIRGLKPGMTEMDAFANIRSRGLAYSAHPVCASGENVLRAMMPSPTSRELRKGDPVLMTCTYQGANTCRFGWIAKSTGDLPRGARDYVDRSAIPYFQATAAWYQAMRVGATGDELHRAVHDILDPIGLKLGLNAGHQIATDEWTDSLVAAGSQRRVRSGMYFQADFFPLTGTPHFGAFAEDGLVIADETLRRALYARYPHLKKRVIARRKFMIEQLGIQISDDVLPLSNFPAAVMPFLLAPTRCPSLA
jgi:Xaa-Pro aminopeptidase